MVLWMVTQQNRQQIIVRTAQSIGKLDHCIRSNTITDILSSGVCHMPQTRRRVFEALGYVCRAGDKGFNFHRKNRRVRWGCCL